MKGKQIKTVEELLKEKVVWVEAWKRHCPVAWIANLSVGHVSGCVKRGQYYKYKKKQ